MDELLKLINILGFSNKSSNSGLYYNLDFDNKFYEITILSSTIFFESDNINVAKYWLKYEDKEMCECIKYIKNHFNSYLRKIKIDKLINE